MIKRILNVIVFSLVVVFLFVYWGLMIALMPLWPVYYIITGRDTILEIFRFNKWVVDLGYKFMFKSK